MPPNADAPTMAGHDPTAALAEFCASAAYDDLDTEALAQLRLHLLDHFGLVVGGEAAAGSSPSITDGVGAIAGEGDATVLASGARRSPDHAALLNGAYAHSLDFDDTHRESSLHPGAPVIPAALATAELEAVTMERFLTAVSTGFDVACLMGRAVNPDAHYDRGFHITATCGTFGATAAAGVVKGLTAAEFEAAFGINGSQAAGSLQFLANGAWNKRLHPGLSARRGVTAAAIAANGFRGAMEPIAGEYGFFHGYTADPNLAAFDDLGDRPAVLETAIKPYPCCRYMHSAIDGLLDFAPSLAIDDIESIRIELPRAGRKLTGAPIERKRRPDNFVDCQFSMPFAAALALSEGEAGLRAFLDAQSTLEDADLRRLMDATEVTSSEAVQERFPEKWAARVEIETRDGTVERFVETASGEPEKPLSWADVVGKFEELAGVAGWSSAEIDDAVATIETIEDATVGEVVSRFREAALTTPDA